MANTLVAELERLAETLVHDTPAAVELALPSLGERIAKYMGVKTDEVAILGISTRWRHLHFLVPEVLKNVGFIPLSSSSALAARTARERKAEINNNFATVRHASVFEGVKTATAAGESIQKIVSAPILYEGKVVGVMQISRKGSSVATAGPDFSAEDLGKVQALCGPVGKLLRHIASE